MTALTRSSRPAVLAVALLFAACGPTVSPSPSASPSSTPTSSPTVSATAPASVAPSASAEASGSPPPDEAAVYREIEEAVIPLRELEPKEEVDPQLLGEEELKERTEEIFMEENPPEVVEGKEVLYRALGMLEDDASLRELHLELLGSQVAGLYDPELDELYVVSRSGDLGVAERITYAHEYTHALQDQHFDLGSFGLDEIGFDDRKLGRLSLIEGDATAVMSLWAQEVLTPEEIVEMFQASLDPEATEILNRMPPILRESLTFPYISGQQLVLGLREAGGWDAVDAAYEDPPASTEQVLHPEKYASREEPIEVRLQSDLAASMGDGWEVTYEDTFGEFQTQVWLRNAIDAETGNAAAAGWGGDRFAVLQGPDDAWAVVMATEWDSGTDAQEFLEAAAKVVLNGSGPHPGSVIKEGSSETREGTRVAVIVASDADVLSVAETEFDLHR